MIAQQDDIRRRPRGIRRAGNGNPDVGLLEGGCIVDAVARHADNVAAFLQGIDDPVLVLGKHLGESVRRFHALAKAGFAGGSLQERVRVQDIRAQAELACRLPRDRPLVPGDHLDIDAHLSRRVDR